MVLILLLVSAITQPSDIRQNPPATRYQNESWELPPITSSPPELPMPKTEAEARTWLTGNKIYDITLASPVRCELELLPAGSVNDDALEKYLQKYIGCLTRVWGPALEQAGYIAYQPQITVFPAGDSIQTPCGTINSQNAFYCSSDQRIYISQDVADALTTDTQQSRVLFNLVIAHEYGHAMQGRTGILAAEHGITAMEEDNALEMSRRFEVQADCFAGNAMNSLSEGLGITDQDRQDILQISYEIGDDQLMKRSGQTPEPGGHGTGDNRRMWVKRGLGASSLGICNAYAAPSSEVK